MEYNRCRGGEGRKKDKCYISKKPDECQFVANFDSKRVHRF